MLEYNHCLSCSLRAVFYTFQPVNGPLFKLVQRNFCSGWELVKVESVGIRCICKLGRFSLGSGFASVHCPALGGRLLSKHDDSGERWS